MLVKVFCGENDSHTWDKVVQSSHPSYHAESVGRKDLVSISLNLFQRIGTELFVVLIKKYFQENLLLKDSIS